MCKFLVHESCFFSGTKNLHWIERSVSVIYRTYGVEVSYRIGVDAGFEALKPLCPPLYNVLYIYTITNQF